MNRTAKLALAVLILLLLGALFVTGMLPRWRQKRELASTALAAESGVPPVNVVRGRRAPRTSTLQLPGNIEAIQVASLFARTNGYLRQRIVDIGDRVRAGQLLAEIEAPEMEQEIRQARAAVTQSQAALGQKKAALLQAQAQLDLAAVTLKRWKQLVKEGVFSPQSGDEKQAGFDAQKATVAAAEADIRAAEANVGSQQANLQRLEELRGFEKITAPFDGIITVRNFDAGALITSGSASGVKEIYKLAQIDTLRIFVNVPQTQVPFIRSGQDAAITVQEFPGRTFRGRVVRTASALDSSSRTLLTEVQVANPDRVLLPGMYGQVQFTTTAGNPLLLIPSTALVIRADGSHAVAEAGSDGKVRFRRISVGRDLGAEVEIIDGLNGAESLILNPADDLTEGTAVQIVPGRKP